MAILEQRSGLDDKDLSKMKSLRPGMAVDMQVSLPNATKRVRTELIGMDNGKVVIVKFPDERKYGPLRDGIYPKAQVVLRLILEDSGEIIAFKSMVLQVIKSPTHAMFVSFPKALQSQVLRAEARAQIHIPVELLDKTGSRKLARGVVQDISLGGCRVKTPKKDAQKLGPADVTLHLNDPSGDRFDLHGAIMNVKQDDVGYYYGIRFDEENEEKERLLSRLMLSF